MGKKRIIKKSEQGSDQSLKERSLGKIPKSKISSGILHIKATYNNTFISLTDKDGNLITWSTSGSLGFKGAKKGTPFVAAKIADLIGDKAKMIGVKDVDIVVNGVGSGRESAIKVFASKGIIINLIKDITPIPHNGPQPKKPRRV
ncbi:MAG: 30S ribosomal protein S11 [Patescibacteria group bacterium]